MNEIVFELLHQNGTQGAKLQEARLVRNTTQVSRHITDPQAFMRALQAAIEKPFALKAANNTSVSASQAQPTPQDIMRLMRQSTDRTTQQKSPASSHVSVVSHTALSHEQTIAEPLEQNPTLQTDTTTESVEEVEALAPSADTSAELPDVIPEAKEDYWYIGVLGQSNALRMRTVDGDGESGQSVLQAQLESSGLADTVVIENYAMGSSVVDGDRYDKAASRPDLIWWHPDTKTPGAVLEHALAGLKADIAALAGGGKEGRLNIVWSQGETDAGMIGKGLSDKARYKQATLDIFHYIATELGAPVNFYIAQTGRYQAGEEIGQSAIDKKNMGHAAVQQAQAELALEYDHIHLGAVTSHYEMQDALHLTTDAYEQVGNDLAMAMKQGYA